MFERIVQFFKARKVTTAIQPKIEVDYGYYSYYHEAIELALKQQWEELLQELEAEPSLVKSREWSSYTTSDGKRHENIILEIDGVVLRLEGPYYADPDWKKPLPPTPKSEEQSANEAIDMAVARSDLLWAVSHCSQFKFNTFVQFIEATRASKKET